jgi:hypothetical protein
MLTQKVAIHDFNGATVQLPLFQLLQFKHALLLEAKGLKHSRGSVATHVRKLLGCPARYPLTELVAHIAGSLADINTQLGIPDAEDGAERTLAQWEAR